MPERSKAFRLSFFDDLRESIKLSLNYLENSGDINSKRNIQILQDKIKEFEKERDRPEDMRRHGRVFGESLIREIFSGSSTTLNKLGVGAGGFGDLGLKLGGNIGEAIFKALGGKSQWGKLISTIAGGEIARFFQTQEGLRMVGATKAPMMTAGAVGGLGPNQLRQMGGQFVRQVIDIRSMTGAVEEDVIKIGDLFSKLGVKFDETGSRATAFVLSAAYMYNVDKQLAQSFVSDAITRFGEGWESGAASLLRFGEATARWKLEAEATKNPLTNLLGSTDFLGRMFAEVTKASGGTSMSIEGMSSIFLKLVDTMSQMGLRPEQMSKYTQDILQKLAPSVDSFDTAIRQSHFFDVALGLTDRGKDMKRYIHEQMQARSIPPDFMTLAVNQLMAEDPRFTASFYTTIFTGARAYNEDYAKRMQLDPGMRKEMELVNWRAFFPGMQNPQEGLILSTFSDQIAALGKQGKFGDEALSAAFKSDPVQQALKASPYSNAKDAGELLQSMTLFGGAQLSTAQKLEMSFAHMYSLTGEAGEKYWEKLKTEGKILYEEAAKFLSPASAEAAEIGPVLQPEDYPGFATEIPGAGGAGPLTVSPYNITSGTPLASPTDTGANIPTGSYSISTANGVESHNFFFDDSGQAERTNAIKGMISEAARKSFPNDPAAVQHMLALAFQESTFNPASVGDFGRAEGLFQFHKELRERFSVGKNTPPEKQVQAAMTYIKELYNKHRGNWRNVIGEFHLGETAFRRGTKDLKYMSQYAQSSRHRFL